MVNKQIIIINGSGGVGKDTFVELCKANEHSEITTISTVDKIKKAANILGWYGCKSEKDRKFLSDLKLLSIAYNDFPYEYVSEKINKFRNSIHDSILFIMVREPEEIDKIKKAFGCLTLLITNKNTEKITSNMADANVHNYKYDIIIQNDGTLKELERKAINFLDLLQQFNGEVTWTQSPIDQM